MDYLEKNTDWLEEKMKPLIEGVESIYGLKFDDGDLKHVRKGILLMDISCSGTMMSMISVLWMNDVESAKYFANDQSSSLQELTAAHLMARCRAARRLCCRTAGPPSRTPPAAWWRGRS